MIWRVAVQGFEEYILVASASRGGARIMASQLGYVPTSAQRYLAANDTKPVYEAIFNTNPGNAGILDLKDQRR